MITNNNTEALATLKTQHIEGVYPDETYITVSSIFSRVGSYENPEKEASSAQPAPTLPVLQRRDTAQSSQDLDVIRRSNALSIADELATQSFKSLGANQPVIKSTGMSFGSLPLPELHSCACLLRKQALRKSRTRTKGPSVRKDEATAVWEGLIIIVFKLHIRHGVSVRGTIR